MELRHTDTNAADDSAGQVFGLEGNLYLWVVGATVLAVGAFAVATLGLRLDLPVAGGMASAPPS